MKKAFTLVEALVVLAICAVALALILPAFFESPQQQYTRYLVPYYGNTTINTIEGHDYIITDKGSICHSESCGNAKHSH